MTVDKIMRHEPKLFGGRFGDTDIELSEALPGIRGDNSGAKLTGETNGCCRFADGRRPDDNYYGRLLHRCL
jgi:hypothetical protein